MAVEKATLAGGCFWCIEAIFKEVISKLQQEYEKQIVTEVTPFKEFYPAEEYHQNYFGKNPEQAYCRAVIAPKLEKFRKT